MPHPLGPHALGPHPLGPHRGTMVPDPYPISHQNTIPHTLTRQDQLVFELIVTSFTLEMWDLSPN